ncbi:MAG: NAD-glutamate dehydrogenase [Methylococcaceae bacterium]|nr:NAD-glutamate dehydrogenase [Methylococcaceae bacterium]
MAEHSTHNAAWCARLLQLATRALGAATAQALWQRYQTSLPTGYSEQVSPRNALKDLLRLEQLGPQQPRTISLLKPSATVPHYRLHFYSLSTDFLDSYMSMLENLHLRVIDQVQFSFLDGDDSRSLRSFTVKTASKQCLPLSAVHCALLATLEVIQHGATENDALNKLLVLTGMSWQAIDVLRAYRNYYLQLGHHTSRASVHHALINNPAVALGLFDYFEARFRPQPDWDDPLVREEQALHPLRLQLLAQLALVADMNDDRILRTLFNLIDATMRCNFHHRLSQSDYFLAFKINSLGVIDMPNPKPQFEIYVHSVAMEGIHLRGGKIARGGIRWSDRPDDFRTEILGLMQTQISKNALIVPTGAKGGFIVKKQKQQTDLKTAGKQAYLTLMRGLLALTDNYVGADIVRPAQLVCYDDPDPYLVVAADKGTATFSDSANQIAADYQFWLGDAFASGGSHGYDHKALGITARGAWICVQRHFRELGLNIQTSPFTVVGIGSMDGDVFGNGMLLSPHTRLLAAFSGQHIFIDPTPIAGDAPFNERLRLFNKPGSSWHDYDRALISEGGGVYARADKDIPLSLPVRQWLGIRYKTLDGESLIRYLLTAAVDLLWLGGIGTYVKASSEKHEDVGDRNNDNVRIDASQLQARVVGEGANLGFTALARIEYSLQGGRINTDAVDNSAGVDTSDHEVNLKILLTQLHKQQPDSDHQALFIAMTDAVCGQVLANNYAQSLCLSLDSVRSSQQVMAFLQWAERLEAAGFLDRAVEKLPSNKTILARSGQTLTRPELAVLMAASKMYLTAQLHNQLRLVQDSCCDEYLLSYFPAQLQSQYPQALATHPLAAAIKAMLISNKLINQAGCTFLTAINDNDPGQLVAWVGCYLSFDRILAADALRQTINALDYKITAASQYHCLLQLEKTVLACCRWAMAQQQLLSPNPATLARYAQHLHDFGEYFNQLESPARQAQLATYHQAGVPDSLANQLVFIENLADFPLLVALADTSQHGIVSVYKCYADISHSLGIQAVLARLAQLAPSDYWEQKTVSELQYELKHTLGRLVQTLLQAGQSECAAYFSEPARYAKLRGYQQVYQEVNSAAPTRLLPVLALVKALAGLLA